MPVKPNLPLKRIRNKIKPKVRKRKEIIKIREEIKYILKEQKKKKSIKQRAGSFK